MYSEAFKSSVYLNYIQLRGAEVHFPFINMEINPNGMVLELLNGNETTNERFRVYWDDSDITRTSGNNQGKAPNPINASIDGSLSGPIGTGGHMWGQQNNNTSPLSSTNLSNGFGNEKSIDTCSYIKGPEAKSNTEVLVKIADLQIVAVTADRTALVAGQGVSYTVRVKNNGPSDVQNSKFNFIVPPGLDPLSAVFSANGCGSEALALSFDPLTRI